MKNIEARINFSIKKLLTAIPLLTLLLCYGCVSGEDDSDDCPEENLINYSNSSQYLIKRIYTHPELPFIEGSSDESLITENLPSQESYQGTFIPDNSFYVTFIREFSTQISDEIAVTTSQPLNLKNCTSYTLQLLENDFFLVE